MCTTIAAKHSLTGEAKGADGWFPIDHLYLAYDHPSRLAAEHAVLIDFATEEGTGRRLGVELSHDDASALARHILEVVEKAQQYETSAALA
jgi:hypothetical protein